MSKIKQVEEIEDCCTCYYDDKESVLGDICMECATAETAINWKPKEVENEVSIKPPIGLIPRNIFYEKRLEAIKSAMHRYIMASLKIPIEWIEEYNFLIMGIKQDQKGEDK